MLVQGALQAWGQVLPAADTETHDCHGRERTVAGEPEAGSEQGQIAGEAG